MGPGGNIFCPFSHSYNLPLGLLQCYDWSVQEPLLEDHGFLAGFIFLQWYDFKHQRFEPFDNRQEKHGIKDIEQAVGHRYVQHDSEL